MQPVASLEVEPPMPLRRPTPPCPCPRTYYDYDISNDSTLVCGVLRTLLTARRDSEVTSIAAEVERYLYVGSVNPSACLLQ